MATSSFSTSNVYDTVVASFFEGAAQSVAAKSPQWEETFDWEDGVASAKRLAPMTGIGDMATWDKTSAIDPQSPAALDPQAWTYVAWAARVRLGIFQVEEIPNYRQAVLNKAGFSAMSTIAEAAASAKADGFTVNQVHGTKPFFATNHERASGTRSNKIATAYDRTAYNAARDGMATWTNYQGQNYNLTGAGLAIEYYPTNRQNVVSSVRSGLTSDQNQFNVAAMDDVIFVENPHLDSASDVIMHSRVPGSRGFKAWKRKGMTIFADRGESDVQEQYTIVFAYGFRAGATPDGAFGITAG